MSPDTLRTPVTGRNLRPGTLVDQLDRPATLVAFLRHLGCMFCREMVGDLRRATVAAESYPPVLLVTQSPIDDLADFFDTRWPEARVIADPQRALYDDFHIGRATFGSLASPMAWTCGVRALVKGNVQSMRATVGDPWLLPALFMISPDGEVHWEYRAKYPGDRPDYAAVPTVQTGGWQLATQPAGY